MNDIYTIVGSTDIKQLIQFVNERIALGYVPLGGVSTSQYDFVQAMVKKDYYVKLHQITGQGVSPSL